MIGTLTLWGITAVSGEVTLKIVLPLFGKDLFW